MLNVRRDGVTDFAREFFCARQNNKIVNGTISKEAII